MDRASASEAGNMGSTPVGRKLKNSAQAEFFKFMHEVSKLLCLRRETKAGAMFLFEVRKRRKAKTARSGPKAFSVRKMTAGDPVGRIPPLFLPRSRLEIARFNLKNPLPPQP